MSYQTRRRAAYVRHRRDNIPAHQALARAREMAVQLLRNYKEKMRVARREVRIATRFARAMENAL